MSNTVMLYTNPMSRGRIARWMLEEVSADYDTTLLTYENTMKGADFLAINPMGKVPAIVHKGKTVTECAAICAYLADAFPEAGLAPPTDQRADYYRWLFFAAGPLEQAITNRSMKFEVTPDQSRMAGYGNFDLARETLIKAISTHEFVAGDTFTAADVYVGAQVFWGLEFGTIPTSPELEAYRDRVLARPAYKRASELDDADGAKLQTS